MATTLNAGVITQRLRYLPALVPDGTTLATIAVGGPPVPAFSYPSLKQQRLVSLRGLQHPSVSAVNLTVQADTYTSRSIDSVASALWQPFDPLAAHAWDASAWNTLQVNVQNGGTVVVDNYWLAANILVQNPIVAQKIKWYGSGSLTPSETATADKAGLLGPHPRGVLPRTFEWIRENEYINQILDAVTAGQTLTVSTSAPTTFVQANAGSREMLVLAGLAVSPGSGSDGLTVIVSLDDSELVLQWAAYPLGSGNPLPVFLQAAKNLSIQMVATTANVTASLSALIWHVRLTEEVQVRMGQLTSGSVFDKIQLGIL